MIDIIWKVREVQIMIPVAIMGHGTVGSGVAEILTTHKHKLFKSIGEELYIKHILDLISVSLKISLTPNLIT